MFIWFNYAAVQIDMVHYMDSNEDNDRCVLVVDQEYVSTCDNRIYHSANTDSVNKKRLWNVIEP